MADGTHKPIDEVEVGDNVWATDPETGITGTQLVVDLIRGIGEKTLVEITIVADRDMLNTVDAASATIDTIMYATLIATSNHPFWNASEGTWTTGADLEAMPRSLS